MIDNQIVFRKLNKVMRFVSSLLVITSCVVFVFSFAACGRRGDPVPIAPYNEKAAEDKAKEQGQAEDEVVEWESETLTPDAPAGLMGLYTQKSVVLAWDEVEGQGVKRYNVYRSSGDAYVLVGDSAAPAFTDREIKPGMKYYYKVTSLGMLESQPSKEIVIVTEVY